MPKRNIAESLWLEFVKHKWPNIVIGSEEYNARRKAFYVGGLMILGMIQKTPSKLFNEVFSQLAGEIKAEVKREEHEIVTNRINIL